MQQVWTLVEQPEQLAIELPDIDLRIDRSLKRVFEQPLRTLGLSADVVEQRQLVDLARQIARAGERPQRPVLLVVDHDTADALLENLRALPSELSLFVVTTAAARMPPVHRYEIADFIHRRAPVRSRTIALSRAVIHTARRAEMSRLSRLASVHSQHLRELNEIGVALSSERNLDRLLELIVTKLRGMLRCDAGSLYLVEKNEETGEPEALFFKVAQNDTLEGEFEEFRMPINRQSISGYVAATRNVLQIPDVYDLPDDCEFQYNRSFDEATGYRARSQLVVPMINHDDEIIGVVQLINKKKDMSVRLTSPDIVAHEVIPFSDEDVQVALSVASQAAVAIENAELYQAIERQFESFIMASVSAIEQRDPTTAGHSERVAILTTGLARAVDRADNGLLSAIRFTPEQMREIRYAALLHDFGKIGVREDVLIKSKKLYEHDLRHIEDRYRLIRKTLELQTARQIISHFLNASQDQAIREMKRLNENLQQELARLQGYLDLVRKANEPRVLPEECGEELREMLDILVADPDGEDIPLLLEWEYRNLSVPRGSLNEEERREIESHVTHTYRFLQLIPWTRELRQVADIAYGHHEKLDGSGYPRGVRAEQIPIQTRMMTISDIFDALTATDRPYKKALPVERALDILRMEVDEGKLDPNLYNVFVEAKIYEAVPAGRPA